MFLISHKNNVSCLFIVQRKIQKQQTLTFQNQQILCWNCSWKIRRQYRLSVFNWNNDFPGHIFSSIVCSCSTLIDLSSVFLCTSFLLIQYKMQLFKWLFSNAYICSTMKADKKGSLDISSRPTKRLENRFQQFFWKQSQVYQSNKDSNYCIRKLYEK